MFVIVRGAMAYWRHSRARHPLPQQRNEPVSLGVLTGAVARGKVYAPANAEHNALVFEKCKKQRRPRPPPKKKKQATADIAVREPPSSCWTRTTQNPPGPSRQRGRARPA